MTRNSILDLVNTVHVNVAHYPRVANSTIRNTQLSADVNFGRSFHSLNECPPPHVHLHVPITAVLAPLWNTYVPMHNPFQNFRWSYIVHCTSYVIGHLRKGKPVFFVVDSMMDFVS